MSQLNDTCCTLDMRPLLSISNSTQPCTKHSEKNNFKMTNSYICHTGRSLTNMIVWVKIVWHNYYYSMWPKFTYLFYHFLKCCILICITLSLMLIAFDRLNRNGFIKNILTNLMRNNLLLIIFPYSNIVSFQSCVRKYSHVSVVLSIHEICVKPWKVKQDFNKKN